MFGTKLNSLWRIMVVARWGALSKWDSRDVMGRHGCGLWKSIMRKMVDFWRFIRFSLGSSIDINFWKDLWIGDVFLKEGFSNLFHLPNDRKASVANYFDSVYWGMESQHP